MTPLSGVSLWNARPGHVVHVCCSVVSDSAAAWTVVFQAPLSVGFSRRGCWSGLPFPSPGALPDPRNEPGSPMLQADLLLTESPGKPLILLVST